MKTVWLALLLLCSCLTLLAMQTGAAAEEKAVAYPETVEALGKRYVDEVTAHRKYGAYSRQACSEGYPNIAHLFKSLAASEGIHARNFSTLLAELGVEVREAEVSEPFELSTTNYNLKHASNVEREEIDREYPALLKRIRPEHHLDAINAISYAWKAEQQHRDLLIKIQKAAIRWFGFLVRRIEGQDSHYHVCQVCGSTLTELPKDHCPICGSHVSAYRSIVPFSATACPVYQQGEDEF